MGRKKKVVKEEVVEVLEEKKPKNSKWVKKEYNVVKKVVDMTNVKVSKFLGYCKHCLGIITNKDKVNADDIYVCAECGKNNKLEQLKDKRNDGPLFASKKDYLDDIKDIGKVAHSSVPLEDHPIDISQLNVQE